jgi:hypothetical protein
MKSTSDLFEISFILIKDIGNNFYRKFWEEKFSLSENIYSYVKESTEFPFISECEMTFMHFEDAVKQESFLSLTSKVFFDREKVLYQILNLNSFLNKIYESMNFEYAFANIETNGMFSESIVNPTTPSDLIISKSSFISIPNHKIKNINLNINHFVFKGDNCTLLFNPCAAIIWFRS